MTRTVTTPVARSPSVSAACTVTVPSACVCAAIASACGKLSASVTVTVALLVAPGAMLAGAVRPIVIAAGPPEVSDPVIVSPSGAIVQKISVPAPSRLATRPATPVKAKPASASEPAVKLRVPLATSSGLAGVRPSASAASFTVSVIGVALTGFAPSVIAMVRLSDVGSPSRSTADSVKLADGFVALFWFPAAAKLNVPSALTVSVPVGWTIETLLPGASDRVSLPLPKLTLTEVTPSAPRSSVQLPFAVAPSTTVVGASDTFSVGRSSTIVTPNAPDAWVPSLSVTVKPMPARKSLSSLPGTAWSIACDSVTV